MITYNREPISIAAALEDSGEYEESSQLTFCGIVVGYEHYHTRGNTYNAQPVLIGVSRNQSR
jgi:hypothetical protein